MNYLCIWLAILPGKMAEMVILTATSEKKDISATLIIFFSFLLLFLLVINPKPNTTIFKSSNFIALFPKATSPQKYSWLQRQHFQ